MKREVSYFILATAILYIYIHNPFVTFLGGFGSIAYLFPILLLYLTDKDVKIFFAATKML